MKKYINVGFMAIFTLMTFVLSFSRAVQVKMMTL